MRKILAVSIISFLALTAVPTSAIAATGVGASCPKAGKTTSVAGKQLICKKSGTKLKWAVAPLPNCSPSTVYDLRDMMEQHDYLLTIPAEVQAYIKEMQFAYANALSWGQMSDAAQAQMNIQAASREAQVAMGEAAKIEREFKNTLDRCKASGVYMSYRYIE